ncbi:sulfotransferase domain-containing protein [Rhizobium sp. KVB221]|uniref:Sulfotransferase domain-containing protein n=1 Tax=Rhizobium setariae TaxID=2801340 RepID=A0A936YMQ6_9HYPH|nr:sulfotransferase domain-containing protein [Rhizobium setariae]MBL0373285.1 sulfotransferase domain-containing protein [Rhizobium setariae]
MTSIARRIVRRVQKRIAITRHAAAADSFLVSYPKSGRTWFRYVLSHYFATVADVEEPVDLHNMFSIVPNFDLDPVRGIPAFRFTGTPGVVPRIWVSHLEYRSSLFLRRPVIMMVRDPRDVIVSAYFHATKHKHRYQGTLSDFIDDQEQGMPAMCGYLDGWARGIAGRPHHILSYEALTADAVAETRAVLQFLRSPVDEVALANAVEAGRFEAMQERERAEGLPAHEYDRSDTESLRMRRGQAGGFGDYLDAAMIARVESHCAKRLTSAAKSLVAQTGLILA